MVKALGWFGEIQDKWINPTFGIKSSAPPIKVKAPAVQPLKVIQAPQSNAPLKVISAPQSNAPLRVISAPQSNAPLTVKGPPLQSYKPPVQPRQFDPFGPLKPFQESQPVQPIKAKPVQPIVAKPAIDYGNPLVFAGEFGKEWVKNAGEFGRYLNPFDKGLFGAESIAENTKTIQDVGDSSRELVDTMIGEKGNGQFDSPKDVIRFVANLPAGMIQAMLEAPKDVREAVVGERLKLDKQGQFQGEHEDLSGWERVGAAGNAAINTAGMFYGGSGVLLASLLKTGAKQAAGGFFRQLLVNSAKEGGEEAVQSLMTDLQTTGGFDEGTLNRMLQSFGLGMAGGAVFDVTGVGIRKLRGMDTDTNIDTAELSNTPNEDLVVATDSNTPNENPNVNVDTNADASTDAGALANANTQSQTQMFNPQATINEPQAAPELNTAEAKSAQANPVLEAEANADAAKTEAEAIAAEAADPNTALPVEAAPAADQTLSPAGMDEQMASVIDTPTTGNVTGPAPAVEPTKVTKSPNFANDGVYTVSRGEQSVGMYYDQGTSSWRRELQPGETVDPVNPYADVLGSNRTEAVARIEQMFDETAPKRQTETQNRTVSPDIDTAVDNMVKSLKEKYPKGITLYHQTDAADAIKKLGFNTDSEFIYFTAGKLDKNRSTSSKNSGSVKITIKPEDYRMLDADPGELMDPIAWADEIAKEGINGRDVVLPPEIANKYLKKPYTAKETVDSLFEKGGTKTNPVPAPKKPNGITVTVVRPKTKPKPAPIKPKPKPKPEPVSTPEPAVDSSGNPVTADQPVATTAQDQYAKQKMIADRKRVVNAVVKIVGEHARKDVKFFHSTGGKKGGAYNPATGRISIKGVPDLEVAIHESMHKAFNENLSTERQAAVFRAILRENGHGNPDFPNMTDAEISTLVSNAEETLNYQLRRYVKDTKNIKDAQLRGYFKDLMAGKHTGRRLRVAKNWSTTGVNQIKQYLISQPPPASSFGDIDATLKPGARGSYIGKGPISKMINQNAMTGADYTPNEAVAHPTKANQFMDWIVDRGTSFVEGLKRMDANLGIKDGMGSKIERMIKDLDNVQNRVRAEIKDNPNSPIGKFIRTLQTDKLGDIDAKVKEFDEYLKIKSSISNKDAGLIFNKDYIQPKRLAELEPKYEAEYAAFQEVFKQVRQDIAPFLKPESLDAMNRNPDYIPMRRDFTSEEKADIFLGKPKVDKGGVTARQGVVKEKQGGSEREIISPTDTMLKMYTDGKQARLMNDLIKGIAEPRYGFVRLTPKQEAPAGMTKMTYFVNGKAKSIAVPKEWARAFMPKIPKVMTDSKVGKVAHALSKPVRWAATAFNVGFQVANPIRDAGSNVVRSDAPVRFTASLPINIVRALSGRGKLYASAARLGIINNTRYTSEMKAESTNILSEVRKASGKKGVLLDAARHPLVTIQKMLNVSENIVRLAEFDAQMQKGKAQGLTGSELENFAVKQANKHLPDYSKSGLLTAGLNEYHPYLGASVAGVRPLARAFKERPVRTTAKVGALVAASTAIALAQMNDGATGDAYDDINDDEKNRNLLFVLSDSVNKNNRADTLKIPLSPDLYGFNTLGIKIAKMIKGTLNGEDMKSVVEQMINSGTPVTVAMGDKEVPAMSAFLSLSPLLLNAFIQSGMNVNYKGKEQFDTYAPEWAKAMSKAMLDGKVATASQLNVFATTLLGNFTNPQRIVNVNDRFFGSYVKSGTAIDTPTGKDGTVKIYQPEGSGPKRIKAGKGDWYEITAGNELAKDNGKIVRLDGVGAAYTGSVAGMSKKDINMLAMTKDETVRDLKENRHDGIINYLTALKNAEDRDVATKDKTHDSVYGGKSFTTAQDLAVAKVHKEGGYDYAFSQTYRETSLTEWREMAPDGDNPNPELYAKLAAYDAARAKFDASGAESDTAKNKYFVKAGGSAAAKAAAARAAAAAKAIIDATKGKKTAELDKAPNAKKPTYVPVSLRSSAKSSGGNKYGPIKVSAKSVKANKDRSYTNIL